MIALVIALVVVTLLGPAAGYFFASRTLRRRSGDHDLRVRQLEDELRRVRGGPAWAQQSGIPSAPPMPTAVAPNRPQQNAPQYPVHGQPVQEQPRRGMTPRERFAQEPPLFGDGASSGGPPPHPGNQQPPTGAQPPQNAPAPPPQPENLPPHPNPQGPAGTAPPPTAGDDTASRVSSVSSPTGPDAPTAPAAPTARDAPTATSDHHAGPPAPDPRTYTPVSDIIDKADAARLDWLGHVSVGRRVRLQRLGYDVPEKLANLRRSEIRRLSRELSVSEEVIRNEWVPAAEAFLRDRDS